MTAERETADRAADTPAFLYGHYACPHTYVAQGRLDLLSAEAPIAVSWRPLPPPADAPRDWLGIAPADGTPADALQELRRDAAGLGLTLSLPATPPDPRPALHAAEFARDCGIEAFGRLHRALFRAVFVDGLDIDDEATLLDLAESAGLDREGLGAALEDERYEPALREAEAEAGRYGIVATPTILIGRFKVVGAAPLEVLGRTLERARDRDAEDREE